MSLQLQPAPLIANLKPGAQKFIKLLKFDPEHPSSKLPLTVYSHSVVRASSYPNLLKENFTAISVGAFLVAYDFNLKGTVEHLALWAIAVPEFFYPAGAGPSQVARSQPRLAKTWPGLDLLCAHGTRDPRLLCQDQAESINEARRKTVLGGGANPRIMRLRPSIFALKCDKERKAAPEMLRSLRTGRLSIAKANIC